MGIRSGGIAGALIVSMVALFSAAPAGAADTITADLSCCSFAPGPYGQDLGEIPTFENPVGADAPHNVTSTVKGPDGGPLFRSQTIMAGNTSPVDGAQYLEGGTYPFYCTLHGLSMGGDLEVSADKGTVVPRPGIQVQIPSQKLRAVRRSGTIQVKVKALSGNPVATLSAKTGAKSLGTRSGVAVTVGTTKTVRLRLTRAGRKALGKGRKAVISVKGSIAFGSPASAKRTIR